MSYYDEARREGGQDRTGQDSHNHSHSRGNNITREKERQDEIDPTESCVVQGMREGNSLEESVKVGRRMLVPTRQGLSLCGSSHGKVIM